MMTLHEDDTLPLDMGLDRGQSASPVWVQDLDIIPLPPPFDDLPFADGSKLADADPFQLHPSPSSGSDSSITPQYSHSVTPESDLPSSAESSLTLDSDGTPPTDDDPQNYLQLLSPSQASTETSSFYLQTGPRGASPGYIRGRALSAGFRRPQQSHYWRAGSPVPRTLIPNLQNESIARIIDNTPNVMTGVFLMDDTAQMVLGSPDMVQTFNPSRDPNFGCFQLVAPNSFCLCGVFKSAASMKMSLRGANINYMRGGEPVSVWINIEPLSDKDNRPIAIKVSVLLDSYLKTLALGHHTESTDLSDGDALSPTLSSSSAWPSP
jgi:hypothetical protein